MKSLVAVIALAFAVAFGVSTTPASAAAIPCWKALINDWFDGKIDDVYERHCYREAIAHLPRDVETYSSAKEDIERALLDSIRENKEPTYDPDQGAGGTPSGSGGPGGGASGGGAAGGGGGGSEGGSKGIITKTIEWLGPSNAEAVPLPLLILAGVAFLLLAAAGGSFLSRRLQERRVPPYPGA